MEKNHAARSTKGVVGKPGSATPIAPAPRKSQPKRR
jgi:hypothetical protein